MLFATILDFLVRYQTTDTHNVPHQLMMKLMFSLLALAISSTPLMAQHDDHHGGAPGHAAESALTIPTSITAEHQELHRELAAALEVGGKTAEAARVVADRLHEHFVKEEALPMPLLGALAPLSRNENLQDPAEALKMSKQLRQLLPEMLEDHVQIKAAVHALIVAARAENHPEVVAFGERLAVHATNEEEVLYPAALLIADVLQARDRH